jgi:DNA-binding transcriptional ArsR family regulator
VGECCRCPHGGGHLECAGELVIAHADGQRHEQQLDKVGDDEPTVSHHLKKLRGAGLLTRTQRGTWAYYALEPTAMARLASVTAPPITDITNGGTR